MSFISYAQNFEDVILWRALQHVEQGFYIDVGANDPLIESVTKAFYERGWHGINIEPLLTHHADLERDRPRDINLQCAAGELNGEIEIWECDVRGWATASEDVVAQYSSSGHSGEFHKVQVYRLADICEKYVIGEIHFLKIDVEGFEKSVICGMDFSRFRPWVMVIEATRPNSTVESYAEWENDVRAAGYDFVYHDGLNRFYVAKEHVELVNSFRYPPNVFDKFIRYEQLNSGLKAQQAEATAKLAESRVQKVVVELQEVYSSRSWRITAPLRWLLQQVRLLRDCGLKSRLRVAGEKVAYKCKAVVRSYLESNNAVKHKIIVVVDRLGFYPVLSSIYRRFIKGASKGVSSGCYGGLLQPSSLDELPPRAKQLYFELKSSSSQQQESH
ncbi:FkbM family methyltransferase [Halomonas sp. M4R5S39]|uniref:FkbM family methyltransferase n=1 Tax=Halomonas kalidii TaxID=3043293 RepID=UPI0024A8A2BC|nr:FkbM family methyltransferase [Halomonas kalidii]MDI5985664.1 FkbM family methyltransferase [Halomonas kalidii]